MLLILPADLRFATTTNNTKKVALLMVSETWVSLAKLPHEATWTIEQASSELCVHGEALL